MKRREKIFTLLLAALFVGGCATTEPAKDEAAETRPAAEQAPVGGAVTSGTYNVVRGDHLWGISSKPTIYGNPYQWPLIYKANRGKIQDADLIHPGQVFTIVRNASAAKVDAAVNHAKTRGAWSLGVVEDSDRAYLGR